ncbi:MAG: SDR family NAD(P)-dependent oxidoreductase [Candidatus Dormibacteraeota bacterium]|nr:SDR family NAD(P)-dependent oxidoreductase [Candidatus Dormibacteraeota bacterium]
MTVALRGASALITGAGGGIGGATAVRFAREGVRHLVLIDIDARSVQRTERLAREAGAEVTVFGTDVSDAGAMQELAESLEGGPGVPDIIVNNAGIGIAGPFLDTPLADLERIVGVNLWGAVHGCRLFGAQLAQRGRGGHIVNVASAAAFAPSTILPAYSMTKAAVLMLSECLRVELAPLHIGVSAVCPGIISTGIEQRSVYAGSDPATVDARRRAATRIYRLRRYPADRVARRIVAAIRRNSAVVPVTPEAHLLRGISRVAPGLNRRLAATIRL